MCSFYFLNIFLSQYVNERFQALGFKQYALGFFSLQPTAYSLRLLVENNGVEPLTSCVQGRRSSQLS
jgi:hypothetical protein